jgi:hypothetical protein
MPGTNRIVLTATTFVVAKAWDQPGHWQIGGITKTSMPQGCFIQLQPPVGALDSFHAAVGLNIELVSPTGAALRMQHALYKIDDEGCIVLFLEKVSSESIPCGSSLTFVEADAGRAD